MIIDPFTNVESISGLSGLLPKSSSITPGSSPTRMKTGMRMTELMRLVYQDRCSALP